MSSHVGRMKTTECSSFSCSRYGNHTIFACCCADTTIQRLKRQYMDTRANRNLDKLNAELQDVQRIMTQNIQDVLGRGEKLESMLIGRG